MHFHLIRGSLGPHEFVPPKGNLDRFIRFCAAHPCDQHAVGQTDRQTVSLFPLFFKFIVFEAAIYAIKDVLLLFLLLLLLRAFI